MAGGGGPHNKSPRRGSGLLEGGWGVVFADWNAPALGGILDQQGVGNVGNSTTYQLRYMKNVNKGGAHLLNKLHNPCTINYIILIPNYIAMLLHTQSIEYSR